MTEISKDHYKQLENIKISIIIPIYNAEPYLERCLHRIRCQTHRNLEVILVNDGSTDKSPEICNKYTETDSRFKVIHKQNGGAASARNIGLNAVTGEWIGFVDSDDYIEADMYEYLLTHAIRYNADVAVCGIQLLTNNKETQECMSHYNNLMVLDKEQGLEMYLSGGMHDGCANKLYRRELWVHLQFPYRVVGEDLLAMWEIFKRADITVRLPEKKYNYCRHDNSVTAVRTAQVVLDDFKCAKERYDEIMVDWPKFEDLAAKRVIMSIDFSLDWYFNKASNFEKKTMRPEIKNMVSFIVPYWKKYEIGGKGIHGAFKRKLMAQHPNRFAWLVTKLLSHHHKHIERNKQCLKTAI